MLVTSFSGIRGIYGRELTDSIARRFGYCYDSFLGSGKKKVIVGMDTRKSGEQLKQAIFDSMDAEFIDVGIVSTPAVELAVREYNADGGVMITASHNEPEYNGFKFLDKDGAVLRERDINAVIEDYREIEKLSEEEFLDKLSTNKKELQVKNIIKKKKDILDRYYRFLNKTTNKNSFFEKNHKQLKKIRILIDPNGGSGIVAKDILERFGVNVVSINDKAGAFKRLVEPNEKSLSYLKDKVKGFSFAAGFDCDADRVELMLSDGSLVNGNYVLALCAYAMNAKKIVVNDSTSSLINEIVPEVIETEVGEINVVDKMYEAKSDISGEGSNGGVIVKPSRCRDGILTLLVIIRLLINKNRSLGEIISGFPKYYTKAQKIKGVKFGDNLKDRIINYYEKKGFVIKKQKTSIKAVKENSFVWFRRSKTEDCVLRVIVDSDTNEKAMFLYKSCLRIINPP